MRVALVIVVVFGSARAASAQEAISGAVTRIDFASYAGTGFADPPGPGQLDSDSWRVTGLADGDMTFGGGFASGGFAAGASSGGVSLGGLWAFSVAPGDPAFGFQQTSPDLTPGDLVVRFANATATALADPTVRFEVWVRNDSGRASSLAFAWSTDDVIYTPVTALDVTTPEAADAAPAWTVTPREATLTGVTLPPAGLLYLRWHVDNASGNGGYDEVALDDVEVEAAPPAGDPDAGPTDDEVPEDDDEDDDGVLDVDDDCPTVADPGQADDDGDGLGDACDDLGPRGAGAGCTAGGDAGAGVLGLLLLLLLLLRAQRAATPAASTRQ